MWRSLARVGSAAAAIVLAQAVAATAEPIQVVYRIGIVQQCEYANGGTTCREYRATFPVTLTFDTDVFSTHGSDEDRTNFYGTPTVSDIPLPGRTDFPPLAETLRQAAERAQVFPGASTWFRESSVLIRQGASQGGSDYHRDLSFIAHGDFASVPELTGASFARFLGTAPFRQFAFADSVELASGGFEALSYRGTISLDAPVATPEPASMFLIGTGLAGMAVRRRRARRS